MMNQCDHDHETKEETRLLPVGGDGNIILCYRHYLKEMQYRREMVYAGTWAESSADFPKWETLKIYAEAVKE